MYSSIFIVDLSKFDVIVLRHGEFVEVEGDCLLGLLYTSKNLFENKFKDKRLMSTIFYKCIYLCIFDTVSFFTRSLIFKLMYI